MKSHAETVMCDILIDISQQLYRPIFSNEEFFDIYDGNLWKETLDSDGNHFFSNPRNLGGLLNVDWFQPFSNCEHSIGVIYIWLW